MRPSAVSAAAALLGIALVACRSDPSDDDGHRTGPDLPACSDVMKLGKVLAADYKGCLDEKGGVVAGTVYDDCDDDRILVKLGYPDLTLGAFLGEPIDEFTGLFNQCYPS